MVTADDEGGHDEPDDEDEAIEDVVVRQNNGTLTNVGIQFVTRTDHFVVTAVPWPWRVLARATISRSTTTF